MFSMLLPSNIPVKSSQAETSNELKKHQFESNLSQFLKAFLKDLTLPKMLQEFLM